VVEAEADMINFNNRITGLNPRPLLISFSSRDMDLHFQFVVQYHRWSRCVTQILEIEILGPYIVIEFILLNENWICGDSEIYQE